MHGACKACTKVTPTGQAADHCAYVAAQKGRQRARHMARGVKGDFRQGRQTEDPDTLDSILGSCTTAFGKDLSVNHTADTMPIK